MFFFSFLSLFYFLLEAEVVLAEGVEWLWVNGHPAAMTVKHNSSN